MQGTFVTFGEGLLEHGAECGCGPSLAVATTLASIGGAAAWVSALPDDWAGDAVLASARDVNVQSVLRVQGAAVGTLHMVPDTAGGRVRLQHRHSAFASSVDGATFDWPTLLSGARWLHLPAASAALGDGPRAAVEAALSASGEPACGTQVLLDLTAPSEWLHPVALCELWAGLVPHLPRVSALLLSEETLRGIAAAEGLWPEDEAGATAIAATAAASLTGSDDPLHAAQRAALAALRARTELPLVACRFERAADVVRSWSVVAFDGGEVSTRATPVLHRPARPIDADEGWVAGFLHAAAEASLHVPPAARASSVGTPHTANVSSLCSALGAACRRAELLAALLVGARLGKGASPVGCRVDEGALREAEARWRGRTADLAADSASDAAEHMGCEHRGREPVTAAAARQSIAELALSGASGPLRLGPAVEAAEAAAHAARSRSTSPQPTSPQPTSTQPRADRGEHGRAAVAAATPRQDEPEYPLGRAPSPRPPTAACSAVFERIGRAKIVPIVSLSDPDDAVPVARALLSGGLDVMELSMPRISHPAAEESLRRIASQLPEMMLGAGSVLSTAQAERALAAGASFVTSPGHSAKLVRWAASRGVPIMPGVATATEADAALEEGLEVLQLFPAEAMGGAPTLAALTAPYAGVRWVPTGGVTAESLPNYLALPAVLAAAVSWLVPADALRRKDFGAVAALALTAVGAARDAKGARVAAGQGVMSRLRATAANAAANAEANAAPATGAAVAAVAAVAAPRFLLGNPAVAGGAAAPGAAAAHGAALRSASTGFAAPLGRAASGEIAPAPRSRKV